MCMQSTPPAWVSCLFLIWCCCFAWTGSKTVQRCSTAVEHASLKNKPSASVQVHKINLHAAVAKVSSSCVHLMQTCMQKINSSAQFYRALSPQVTLKSMVTAVPMRRRATDPQLFVIVLTFWTNSAGGKQCIHSACKVAAIWRGEMNNALRLVRYSNYFFPLPVCFIFIMSSSFPWNLWHIHQHCDKLDVQWNGLWLRAVED